MRVLTGAGRSHVARLSIGLALLAAGARVPGLAAADTSPPAPRIHRLIRLYDWSTGFPWSYTAAVEQDRQGFLWLTTTSGLYRFDGRRAVRMAGEGGILAAGGTASGRIVLFGGSLPIREATPQGLVPLASRGPQHAVEFVAVSTDGAAWNLRDGVVERLEASGDWKRIDIPSPGDAPRLLRPGRGGRMFVLTRSAVWVAESDASVRLLASVPRAFAALERADGTVIVGANAPPGPVTTRLYEVSGGGYREVYSEENSRLISIAERGEKIWVAMDRALVSLGPGYVPKDRLSELPSCGSLLVDREQSLWMATSRGLVQIPEPDVSAVRPGRGGVTHLFARTQGGVWATFWGTLAYIADEPGGLRLTAEDRWYGGVCGDHAGRVWTAGGEGIQRLLPGGRYGPSISGSWNPSYCGDGLDGRRWIVSGPLLWLTTPDADWPRPFTVTLPNVEAEGVSAAAEGPDGTLWIAAGSRICRAPVADVLDGRPVGWQCDAIENGGYAVDLRAMPSGEMWALIMSPGAILRRVAGRWEPVAGWESLGVGFFNSMTPSPRGGVWLTGQGLVLRVGERKDPPGLEVLERPTAWNGLISINVVRAEEDPDGTLWLGTDLGIQKIPPEIRDRRPSVPAVELVDGTVNGVPLDPAAPVKLPWRRNRLETHFTAISYRDPTALRYRMRLREGEAWSAPDRDGHYTFVDLPPGRYALQVAASLDGERWSPEPATLALDVTLPLYARSWFLGGTVVGMAALGHVGYRLRARRRLDRERQRTRIAMDLHDEVGSGLGTIAVLAGIAARPELPEARREEVAERIAAVSQELARSLGDIVWSLRPSSGSLDALWNQLLERARPLFAADSPKMHLEAPDPVPDHALSLVVRRNLHLVAYEALHNASRHAGATVVWIRLAPEGGGGWRLEIEDDGRGLPAAQPASTVRRGLGLEAMKARVAEMDGAIVWDRGPLGGTRVSVRFRTGEG